MNERDREDEQNPNAKEQTENHQRPTETTCQRANCSPELKMRVQAEDTDSGPEVRQPGRTTHQRRRGKIDEEQAQADP